MTAGYQIAQVAHAVADFALHRPEQFQNWHKTSQYIIALQTENLTQLELLLTESESSLDVIPFREPDLNDELTSIAFVPDEQNKRHLSNLPLAGRKTGVRNKHHTVISPRKELLTSIPERAN